MILFNGEIKMTKENLNDILSQIRGAKTYLRADKNSSIEHTVIFANVKCEIFNIELFEKTVPDFLQNLIENSKLKEAIKSYNEIGGYGEISCPIEVDFIAEEKEFDGISE